MVELDDIELFDRSVATLLESWRYFASGSPEAEVIESGGASIAAFVRQPEREFLNNAVLERGRDEVAEELDQIERAYAERGVERHAIWVHESDEAAAVQLRARGHRLDTSTRTMAMPIEDLADSEISDLDVFEAAPEDVWKIAELEGFVPGLTPDRAHFYAARLERESVAAVMAFDHEGDCGLYMVTTLPPARRRGLATKLSAHAVTEAVRRGCVTAQSAVHRDGRGGLWEGGLPRPRALPRVRADPQPFE